MSFYARNNANNANFMPNSGFLRPQVHSTSVTQPTQSFIPSNSASFPFVSQHLPTALMNNNALTSHMINNIQQNANIANNPLRGQQLAVNSLQSLPFVNAPRAPQFTQAPFVTSNLSFSGNASATPPMNIERFQNSALQVPFTQMRQQNIPHRIIGSGVNFQVAPPPRIITQSMNSRPLVPQNSLATGAIIPKFHANQSFLNPMPLSNNGPLGSNVNSAIQVNLFNQRIQEQSPLNRVVSSEAHLFKNSFGNGLKLDGSVFNNPLTNSANLISNGQAAQRNAYGNSMENDARKLNGTAFKYLPTSVSNFRNTQTANFFKDSSSFARSDSGNETNKNLNRDVRRNFSSQSSNNYRNAQSTSRNNWNFSKNDSPDRFRNHGSNFNPPYRNYNRSADQPRHNKSFTSNNTQSPKEKKCNSFYCDTCDRAFAYKQDLDGHLAEHTTCNVQNCKFVAHPKIVALHKKMQHDTGYSKLIGNLYSEEEIKKWREERKKNFPTLENRQKRQVEQQEKQERGEVIVEQDFGTFKKQKFDHNNPKRNNFRRRQNQRRRNMNRDHRQMRCPNPTTTIQDVSDSESDPDSHIMLHKFTGISYGTNGESIARHLEKLNKIDSSDNRDDHVSVGVKEGYIDLEIPHTNDIRNIVDIEDTGSNEEAAATEDANESTDNNSVHSEIPIIDLEKGKVANGDLNESVVVIDLEEVKDSTNKEVVTISDSDDSPVEMPIEKEPLEEIPSSNKPSRKRPKATFNSTNRKEIADGHLTNDIIKDKVDEKPDWRKPREEFNEMPRKSSLLEKLLADDIRHERNLLMQCIRHVVRNDFFNVS